MSLGAVTLGALALAIVLSCTSRLNVGLLALALAWIIGVYVGGLPLRDVTAGFPIDLFLTLSGVTLLFAQAHVNGTLDIVAHNAMRLVPRPRRRRADHVLCSRCGARVRGPRQHRDDGSPGTDGDGDGAQDAHLAVPDGDHGRQRLQLGLAVAARADGHHRDGPHGAHRAAGPRAADVGLQLARARDRGLRGLFPVRRLEATHARRSSRGRGRADQEPRPATRSRRSA